MFARGINLRSFLVAFFSYSLVFAADVKSNDKQDTRWKAAIPKVAEKSEDWHALVNEMLEAHMYYGALAAAHRMLSLFSDLPTKEKAYETIIDLIDRGYPYSTRNLFVSGDLTPVPGSVFGNDYNLYKALVNKDKKVEKWSKYYLEKVDQKLALKYKFFVAIEAYREKKLPEAVTLLKEILADNQSHPSQALVKKVSRTLARIYYEQEKFAESFDIYNSFLMKLNPITSTDWLEAAWNLYQLKRYDEALGLMYNLESKAPSAEVVLEKYVLRALLYRSKCSEAQTKSLLTSFNKDFGSVIDGIKMGEPLSKYALLKKINNPRTQEYRQVVETLSELEFEQKEISSLSGVSEKLASHLFQTEIKMLQRQKSLYEDQALDIHADYIVILGESLRFLKFDVARERFSPDRIFQEEEVALPDASLVEEMDEKSFRLHWRQKGDYWRDERLLFRGIGKSRCD